MSLDLTDLGPSRICPCGGETFKILATFDEDYSVASYDGWIYCEGCGSRLTAPMPGVNC